MSTQTYYITGYYDTSSTGYTVIPAQATLRVVSYTWVNTGKIVDMLTLNTVEPLYANII